MAETSRVFVMISTPNFIHTLNRIADIFEPDTKDHSSRVKEIALRLASRLGYSGNKLMYIGYGADIHDIGKVGIPSFILSKPAGLNDSEYAAVKKHAELGHEILEYAGLPKIVLECVLYHQERYDGSGYPYGLKGSEVPLHAGIVAIADVWDAIRSPRPYRPAMSLKKALKEMEKCSSWFIPEVYFVWRKYEANKRPAHHKANKR